MKASKFSDAEKAFILEQGADGVPVAEICRKAGIGQATYFNWKKKYEGLTPPEMRRLKQLEGTRPVRLSITHISRLRGRVRLAPKESGMIPCPAPTRREWCHGPAARAHGMA